MRIIVLILSALLTGCCAVSYSQAPNGSVITSGAWGMVWSCGSTYKVLRNTEPPANKAGSVAISAASNEFEPFQLIIRPNKDLENVKVTTHTLSNAAGSKIPAWNITARNVDYVLLDGPTSDNMPQGYYPDPLPEFAPFKAAKGVNSPVWITVYVPKKTPPGDYTGTVDIVADGMQKLSIPVKLHVWNFELPSVSNLKTAFGCNMSEVVKYQGASNLEEKRKLLDIYNLEFWRHRLSPNKPYTFYDVETTIENDTPKIDFTEFDKAVKKYFPLFNTFELPKFGKAPKDPAKINHDEDRYRIEYMRQVIEHLADKGYDNNGYHYIFDEPEPEHYKSIKLTAELDRNADERIKVLLTEQVENDLIGSVDIWVPQIAAYDEAKSKERQKAGEQVWWYICCSPHHPFPNYFIEYPAIDSRILPWITWRYDVDGILYWATVYWKTNPWESPAGYQQSDPDKMKGNGDGMLLYPPVKKPSDKFVAKAPVPSIRWELIREGMEDYDYFHILKQRLEKAKKANPSDPAVAKAEQALAQVVKCAKSRTEYTQDPAQLESARKQIAAAIESLGAKTAGKSKK